MNSIIGYDNSCYNNCIGGPSAFHNYNDIGSNLEQFGSIPSINIFIINTPNNYNYPTNYAYPTFLASPVQFNYFNSPYQIPIIQQPQPYEVPNFYIQSNESRVQKKKYHKTKSDDKKRKKIDHKKSDKKSKNDKKVSEKTEIDCSNGLFDYFFSKCKKNPITMGIVEITGNSFNEEWATELPNIINPMFTSYWLPEETEERFFKIDFKTFSFKITKYKIRFGDEDGMFICKNWTLTGTLNNGDEIVLDNVKNCREVNNGHPSATIGIKTESYLKSIKLSLKGNNENGDLTVDIGNIELYGYLKYD